MSIFKGSGVALVTPFKYDKIKNIVVDYKKLEELVEFHINNKTDSIIICGTTGEAATMREYEQLDCISKCVKFVNKRIPVIAGTGSNNTTKAVYLSERAELLGADALLCVTPYYNKTNQDGLKLYYKRIADSVDIPIIMYNVPSRTGLNIDASTACDIAKNNPNIVAIKEASGNIEQIKKIKENSNLDIYSGNDNQIYDIMSLGGSGVISVLANICPLETHEIVSEYLNGHFDYSYFLQNKYTELCQALSSDVNPIPIKKAMEYLNLSEGILREPLVELDEEKTKKLVKTLNKYNLKSR